MSEYLKAHGGNVEKGRLDKFNVYVNKVEEKYKSEMYSTRRGNGVIDSVSRVCKAYGHKMIAVLPFFHKDDYYLYRVIAYRQFDNTYTVWIYNSCVGSFNNVKYELSIVSACREVGLIFSAR